MRSPRAPSSSSTRESAPTVSDSGSVEGSLYAEAGGGNRRPSDSAACTPLERDREQAERERQEAKKKLSKAKRQLRRASDELLC